MKTYNDWIYLLYVKELLEKTKKLGFQDPLTYI